MNDFEEALKLGVAHGYLDKEMEKKPLSTDELNHVISQWTTPAPVGRYLQINEKAVPSFLIFLQKGIDLGAWQKGQIQNLRNKHLEGVVYKINHYSELKDAKQAAIECGLIEEKQR